MSYSSNDWSGYVLYLFIKCAHFPFRRTPELPSRLPPITTPELPSPPPITTPELLSPPLITTPVFSSLSPITTPVLPSLPSPLALITFRQDLQVALSLR